MKTILSIESDSKDKLNLLIKLAREMGMTVETSSEAENMYSMVSESALSKDWDSQEDKRWDEAFAHLKS